MSERHFPPPWTAKELVAAFIVKIVPISAAIRMPPG